jgi:hypothetical protein
MTIEHWPGATILEIAADLLRRQSFEPEPEPEPVAGADDLILRQLFPEPEPAPPRVNGRGEELTVETQPGGCGLTIDGVRINPLAIVSTAGGDGAQALPGVVVPRDPTEVSSPQPTALLLSLASQVTQMAADVRALREQANRTAAGPETSEGRADPHQMPVEATPPARVANGPGGPGRFAWDGVEADDLSTDQSKLLGALWDAGQPPAKVPEADVVRAVYGPRARDRGRALGEMCRRVQKKFNRKGLQLLLDRQDGFLFLTPLPTPRTQP